MEKRARGIVAVILSACVGAGILMLTGAALYDAIKDPQQAGVSPEYSALLTATLGVLVGGLVGYIGGREAAEHEDKEPPPTQDSGDGMDDDEDWGADDPEPPMDPYDEQMMLDEPDPDAAMERRREE